MQIINPMVYIILVWHFDCSSRIEGAQYLHYFSPAYRTLVRLSHGLEDGLVGTVAAHYPMGAIQEDRIDLLAQANLAHILIVLLLDLEDLRELANLLLQPPNLLLHLHFLSVAELWVVAAWSRILLVFVLDL